MNLINLYKKDLKKTKTLIREEEDSLFIEYSINKELKIKNEIFNHYLKKVITIINSNTFYFSEKIQFLDLVQFGNMFLWDLIDKYDYKEKASFGTYLTICLKIELISYIKKTKHTVYLPLRHQRELKEKDSKISFISLSENEDEDRFDLDIPTEDKLYELPIEDSFSIMKRILNDEEYNELIIEFEKTNKIPKKYLKQLCSNKSLQRRFIDI